MYGMWFFKHADKVKLTDEQKQALLGSVDYSRLSEGALLRAFESDLIPQNHVTKAALDLCAKLRAELDEAKLIMISQEREIEKLTSLQSGVPRRRTSGLSLDFNLQPKFSMM